MYKIEDKRSSKQVNQDNFCTHGLTSSHFMEGFEICILCGQLWQFNKKCKQWVESDMNAESRYRMLKMYQSTRNTYSEEKKQEIFLPPTLFV